MKQFCFSLLITLFSVTVFAQEKGFIRGNIGDGQFGGPLIGANVTIPALSGVGATTDFDGNYSISIAPGVYEVKLSYISFTDQFVKDVEVKAGEVTKIDGVLEMATQEVAMVEVVATVRKNSEAGVLMDMRNATVVSDGLSAQSFRKTGDSDLSGAIRRVTGWDRNLQRRRCHTPGNPSYLFHRCPTPAGPVDAIKVTQDFVMDRNGWSSTLQQLGQMHHEG